MAVTNSFLEFVLDQISGARRDISHKRMFGGVGLYADERFVALISGDRLYLKVDDSNRADFEREESKVFQPYGEGTRSMSYYEVPVRVLEDRDELAEWLERSWVVAGKKKSKSRR